MSRIGLKPIPVPDKVSVEVENSIVAVKGPKGELKQHIHPNLNLVKEDGGLRVERPNNERENRSQHGLARTLIHNMVVGVTEGHVKALEVHGVGYRAQVQGNKLVMALGYSHPVEIVAPDGITFDVPQPEKGQALTIWVRGIDKALVGQVAADIRKSRKPDPYKGKGVRYKGEVVRTRPGKRAGK
ncbi:MAG: 50S ribosomal protein L6 [Fimbriimonadaceae bacterium]|nr:50S ribosomal protein L6 [Fimbriimonadaceae bacterium]